MAPYRSTAPAPAKPSSVTVDDENLHQRDEPRNLEEGMAFPLRSMKEIVGLTEHVELKGDKDEADGGCDAEKDYSEVVCEKCGSGEKEEELLLCDKCDKGFHMLCLRPIAVRVPIGPWHCPDCSGDRRRPRERFSPDKIMDFFGINKCSEFAEKSSLAQDVRRRRKPNLVYRKKSRALLPFIPTQDPDRLLIQMCSLASALTANGMEFTDKLNYVPGIAPRSANKAKFEDGGMQVLLKKDTETLQKCRAMCKSGLCPPLIVVFDSLEGYTVETDGPIKDMTIIAEYAGDVDYIRNRLQDDSDNMMSLLLAKDPTKSLLVCADKRGNISRFINGINNHTSEGRKKKNLKCVRYNVNGECLAFFVAIRDIAKGERLYYDYNGYEDEYPTHHFI